MMSSAEVIAESIRDLSARRATVRGEAAKRLGTMIRSRPSRQEAIIAKLEDLKENDPDPFVRTTAKFAILEIQGVPSEKYEDMPRPLDGFAGQFD